MQTVNIRIGSTVIECEAKLAVSAGYAAPYSNDETHTARGGQEIAYGTGQRLTPDQALAIALSEGHGGEMAVMRAIAIRTHGVSTREAQVQLEAANARNAAAQAELRAEQIRNAREKRDA